MSPEERLAARGVELPEPPPPAASYVPTAQTGSTLFTSGQVATEAGALPVTGKCGPEVDVETGQLCARRCAVNVMAQLKGALGDLSRVERVVKVTVFVASDAAFTDQHLVANGASELIGEVFGDAGVHARSAVGVPSLPMDSPVEVEAIVEIG